MVKKNHKRRLQVMRFSKDNERKDQYLEKKENK